MSREIDIAGLDKVEVFRRLYNAARTQGLGLLHYTPDEMTPEQAAAEFGTGYFDYHRGRVMKVDVNQDKMLIGGYDRDNGEGAARRALGDLLA